MKRRQFTTLLGVAAAAWPFAAWAQQPGKLPRIGVLVSASPPHPFAGAFRHGLRSFGYTEGKNITIEFLYTDARSDRATEFAAELVRSGVDIIVAHFTPAVRAAIAATRTIPIVMAPAGAPLQQGLVDSLARPSGNVTGLSAMDAEIGGKRLQLLRELMPNLVCVAVLAATPEDGDIRLSPQEIVKLGTAICNNRRRSPARRPWLRSSLSETAEWWYPALETGSSPG
jgi:putative tryptophan/tyrosine transport system substrate-binding protein